MIVGWHGLVWNISRCLPLLPQSRYFFVLHSAVFHCIYPILNYNILDLRRLEHLLGVSGFLIKSVLNNIYVLYRVPFNREHNDLIWCSKERRLSNITPRFLTLSSICFTVPFIVNWNVSVRLLTFGVAKECIGFYLNSFSIDFHCTILALLSGLSLFNCSRLFILHTCDKF